MPNDQQSGNRGLQGGNAADRDRQQQQDANKRGQQGGQQGSQTGCQRRYKMGPATGLKTGQLVQTKSLGLRLDIIGCGEAAVAERKPISRSR